MLDIYRNAIDSEPKARGTAQNNKPPALALEKTAVVDNAKLATDRDAKLYKAKFGDTESQQDNHGKPPLHATFTRHAKNEIKQLFPRLPNPDILIYVYPHLATAEQVPIPGYTTAMPLYERVHYAMPGDFIPARRSEQHALPAHQSVRP
jgi:conjugative transfer region lipoprotein (TIGR03751 family)